MATTAARASAQTAGALRAYAIAALLFAGAVASIATIWFVDRSPIVVNADWIGILRGVLIATWVGAGTYMWWRRPESRLGLLVAGVALVYAGTSLMASEDGVAHTIGRVVLAAFVVCFSYVYLCFPGDRLVEARDRWSIGALAVATGVLWPFVLVFSAQLPSGGALNECGSRCPANAFQLVGIPEAAEDVLNGAVAVVTALGLVGIAIVLLMKARAPGRLRRRAVEPVLYTFGVVAAAYVANVVASPSGRALEITQVVAAAGGFLTPAAMLAGQAQARTYAAAALGRLVVRGRAERLSPAQMQDWLRDALGDPTLEVALWDRLRFRFVDINGRVTDVLSAPPGRATATVTQDGRPVAVLTYSASLQESADVVDGLAETAVMLLENTRLVDELRASRARIVASGDQERHRLERDLHDGAQQRLFLLQVKLARLREELGDAAVAARIDEIEEDARAALEELRVLAHGIYPTVLVERGVPEALRAFALDAPLPVEVNDHWIGRCSPTIEAALYFCALEAIQNAAKHAGTEARVTIDLDRDGDRVDLSVADDGVGFQTDGASDGIGLVTMRDRIGAVGGELEVVSEPGAGVTVHVTVPGAPERAAGDIAESSEWQSE
ncbi:MAG: sensor histidine kinase [Gaiellaceae bacterium]